MLTYFIAINNRVEHIDTETYIMVHALVKLLQPLFALRFCIKLLSELQEWIEELCSQQQLSSCQSKSHTVLRANC